MRSMPRLRTARPRDISALNLWGSHSDCYSELAIGHAYQPVTWVPVSVSLSTLVPVCLNYHPLHPHGGEVPFKSLSRICQLDYTQQP